MVPHPQTVNKSTAHNCTALEADPPTQRPTLTRKKENRPNANRLLDAAPPSVPPKRRSARLIRPTQPRRSPPGPKTVSLSQPARNAGQALQDRTLPAGLPPPCARPRDPGSRTFCFKEERQDPQPLEFFCCVIWSARLIPPELAGQRHVP